MALTEDTKEIINAIVMLDASLDLLTEAVNGNTKELESLKTSILNSYGDALSKIGSTVFPLLEAQNKELRGELRQLFVQLRDKI